MFSLTKTPWNSKTDNIYIHIEYLSDLNNRVTYLEKLSLLQDFFSFIWRHFQIVVNSRHSLRPRWHISPHSSTTIKNQLSTQGGVVREIYHYLYIIGYPTTLTYSVQWYRHFCPWSSTNNDTETLQTVIIALHFLQKTICELYGRIRH